MDEVGLIEVAGFERDVRPMNLGATRNLAEGLLEAADTAEEFWREADFVAEDVDEMARADADLICDGGDSLRFGRSVKFVEREGDGRMALGLAGGDGDKLAFQNFCFGLWRWSFQQLVANTRGRGVAPEIVEPNVQVEEFAEGKFEERMGAAGFEVDAGNFGPAGSVDAKGLGVGTADNAVAKEFAMGQRFVREDREAAGAEVKDKFDRAVRKQALFGVRRSGGFHDPDHFDEAVEWRPGLVAERQHEASLLPLNGGAT